MAKTTVVNISKGPRGLRDTEGNLVMIESRQSAEIELSASERKDADASGYFEFGDAAAKRAAKAETEGEEAE